MGRKKVDADRKQKIIEATLNCIHKFGYQDTTVARICADVGLSAGNIHYYFGGKQNLLEEAMRSLLRNVREKMVTNLNVADSPTERIVAILRSNFHPELFHAEICITWLHFWAQAPHAGALARLEYVNRGRFLKNLVHELVKIQDRTRAELTARQIVAMVDGLWVEKAQKSSGLGAEEAFGMTLDFVKTQFPHLDFTERPQAS